MRVGLGGVGGLGGLVDEAEALVAWVRTVERAVVLAREVAARGS